MNLKNKEIEKISPLETLIVGASGALAGYHGAQIGISVTDVALSGLMVNSVYHSINYLFPTNVSSRVATYGVFWGALAGAYFF